jgi:hypothetical protein
MLDKAQLAEINDLYDGSWGSIRQLASIFKVGETVIRYAVDHKGYRNNVKKWALDWQKRNLERYKEINNRAQKRYQQSEKGTLRVKEYYKKNHDKILEQQREYCRKNHDKISKRQKEYHKRLKLRKILVP